MHGWLVGSGPATSQGRVNEKCVPAFGCRGRLRACHTLHPSLPLCVFQDNKAAMEALTTELRERLKVIRAGGRLLRWGPSRTAKEHSPLAYPATWLRAHLPTFTHLLIANAMFRALWWSCDGSVCQVEVRRRFRSTLPGTRCSCETGSTLCSTLGASSRPSRTICACAASSCLIMLLSLQFLA
jgi:hypothetical protein